MYCGNCKTHSKNLCSGCLNTFYCNMDCQIKDWKIGNHMKSCKLEDRLHYVDSGYIYGTKSNWTLSFGERTLTDNQTKNIYNVEERDCKEILSIVKQNCSLFHVKTSKDDPPGYDIGIDFFYYGGLIIRPNDIPKLKKAFNNLIKKFSANDIEMSVSGKQGHGKSQKISSKELIHNSNIKIFDKKDAEVWVEQDQFFKYRYFHSAIQWAEITHSNGLSFIKEYNTSNNTNPGSYNSSVILFKAINIGKQWIKNTAKSPTQEENIEHVDTTIINVY